MPKLDERAIFDAARRIESPEARRQYLQQACGDDRSLLSRVEQLLRVHDEDSAFLQSPAVPLPLLAAEDGAGAIVGAYKLLEQIGEGGFGIVYMAEQLRPVHRRVALKIVKPGMDTRQVVARFEAERQALAMMDHPNIARVFDAGATPAGRPYFVMELVKGVPITRYCDEQQLAPRHRLKLFVAVCKAVQHAHQKGIIHRDLKPSNVLVAAYDGQPVPKIIDFGVAKALGGRLTERTLVTSFGGIIGTLEYMSPEQAEFNALDVDTRADNYSLGVLLYELLTGTTPLTRERLKQTAMTEALRLIREEDPPKPSTRLSDAKDSLASISVQRKLEPAELTQELRGELDWIVMKALDKNRNRRYQTANGLARDIERYLNDEPVEACPPSSWYRLGKFARKNRRLLSAVAAFGLLLGVATVVSGWLAYRATLAEQARVLERDRAEQHAMRADRHAYAAHMNLAQIAWQENRLGRLSSLLDEHRPQPGDDDPRGFEWYYWRKLADTALTTFEAHRAPVYSVAVSPDGKWLATGGGDHTAKIWDAATGRELHTLRGHGEKVIRVAFSPKGELLATTDSEGDLRVWNAAGGTCLGTIKGHTDLVTGLSFDPDGRRMVSASHDGTVKLWDVGELNELATLRAHSDQVHAVAFSPDGLRIASASKDKTVKLCDAESGRVLLTLQGHTHEVAAVAFAPDGARLASASLDRTAKVWNATTGECLATLAGHGERLFSVAFSPDGARLATSSFDQTIRLWDAKTLRPQGLLKGHGAFVLGIAFHPDSRRLFSAGYDHTLRLWSAAADNPKVLDLGRPGKRITEVAFSPSGDRLASVGDDPQIRLWDLSSGQTARTLHGHTRIVWAVAFSPDGKRLASASEDQTIRIWDASTGNPLRTQTMKLGRPRLAFSPDAQWIAVSCDDHTIAVFDAKAAEQQVVLRGHEQMVASLAFSPDGKWLASGSRDQTVRLWEVASGKELRTFRGHAEGPTGIAGLAFSPDGRWLASAGADLAIKLWDVATGRELTTLQGHNEWISGLAFSPDGRRLASSSADKTVKLWDLATREEILTFNGHPSLVLGVAFSPDGWQLASAGFDGVVRVWDARPWTPQLRAQSEARPIVRQRPESGLKADLVRRIEDDLSLPDDVRREALEMAERYEEDADDLNLKSWQVVRQAGASPETYALALRQAEAACRLQPDNWWFVNTLGIALYRSGKLAEARSALTHSVELYSATYGGRHPCDVAALAMANFRLGQVHEARQLVAQARGLVEKRGSGACNEERDLLREASQLIAGDGRQDAAVGIKDSNAKPGNGGNPAGPHSTSNAAPASMAKPGNTSDAADSPRR